jgi:hypothetical protein
MPVIPSPSILSTDEMGRIAPPILSSVGRSGTNAPEDVFVVQSLLNERLPRPHTPVPVTGIADIGTTLAIEAYQAVVLNMAPPTGRVEPGSTTYYALAARPTITTSSIQGHYGELPQEIIDAAVLSQKRWRVPASISIAQWVVESAWGASMPPSSNNPFGIKATGNEPSVDAAAREFTAGEFVTISARFRIFPSVAQAFDEHGRLLATGGVYRVAMQNTNDPNAFADALNGAYATDPNYSLTLKWVMQTYGFSRYDQ